MAGFVPPGGPVRSHHPPSYREAALTIARMPARIASGSVGQASTSLTSPEIASVGPGRKRPDLT